MIAEKYITEPTELEITGITLLSKEEYEAHQDLICLKNDCWWLRSPYSNDVNDAGFVDDYGYLDIYNVGDSIVGVSPALQICNLESSNLEIGDKFKLKGYTWTVISENLAQCDGIIGYSPFRRDWKAKDANVYEKSDVKKYVEKWWEKTEVKELLKKMGED